MLLDDVVLTVMVRSTAALILTGGAALLHQSWPLMTRAGKAEDSPLATAPVYSDWGEIATVPLTFACAGRVERHLSGPAVDALNHISGIILLALCVQLSAKGQHGLSQEADAGLHVG